MNYYRKALPAALALALALSLPGYAGVSPALDFELSDGQRFIRLATLPERPTVVNFWRADCPPCLRELPLLAAFANQGTARVITIALQRPNETANAPEHVLNALRPPLLALHGPSEPRGLLARFGNRSGALPHTVILDTQRRRCAQHSGEINAHWLQQQLALCAAQKAPSR
ncbi:TlpA family protein disulfide reductase [Azonexus sp.]|uniref:TlpA family protein disulfide reductase n=1 Tax=Azonexus sp. TaxID=1872668 RepID=UPI0039E5E12E